MPGVVETARRVAAGEVTAAAVTDACLARIAERDGALGAYLALAGDGARAGAAAVDRARAAGPARRARRRANLNQGPDRHPRARDHRRVEDLAGSDPRLTTRTSSRGCATPVR